MEKINKDEQEDFQKDLEKKSENVEGASQYGDILSTVIHEGETIFQIKNKAVFLSAIIAGLEIGFSYILVCTVFALASNSYPIHVVTKFFAIVYPVGFVLVILGKSALFTQQTSVLALPVLNGQHSILEMLRIWGVVIIGNIIGGNLIALFIGLLGPRMNLFTTEAMADVGMHVLDHKIWVIFLSAIAAGWLMGLLTWLSNSTQSSTSKILIIFMITGTIGFLGLHHSIVGNIEVFGAFLNNNAISLWDYLSFVGIAIVGNGIGGAIVVGLFKYRIFESNYVKANKT